MTTDSPCIVGTVDTRRSISLPCTRRRMRPSCGSLRSAMSRFAMIFTREITAAEKRRGGDSTSCSTPSMRKRTTSRFSNGSMWMSDARASSALVMMSDTSRITGASAARSFSCCTSASNDEIVAASLLDVADDLSHRRAARAVQPLERRLEVGRDRDQRAHLAAGDHAKRADRVLVGRIRHREPELVLLLAHRQRARLAQEPRGDALLENRQLGIAFGVDEGQSQLRGERLRDVALRRQPERDQQCAEPLAGLLLQAQRALETRRIELAALDENLAESLSRGSQRNGGVQRWRCSKIGRR